MPNVEESDDLCTKQIENNKESGGGVANYISKRGGLIRGPYISGASFHLLQPSRGEEEEGGGAKREVGEELFSLVMLFLPENLGSVSSLEGSRTCSSTQICNTQGTIYREKVTAEQVPDLQFF